MKTNTHVMEQRFITHLVIHGALPTSGLRKLFFYTRLTAPNEYYWGAGNNTFSEDEMRGKETRKTVIRLPEDVELFEKKGLWVDKDANIFYTDLVTPNKDPEKKFLFTCTELLSI